MNIYCFSQVFLDFTLFPVYENGVAVLSTSYGLQSGAFYIKSEELSSINALNLTKHAIFQPAKKTY